MNRKQRRSHKDPADLLEQRFDEGMRFMAQKKFDKAADIFTAIMKEQPTHYRAIEQIGVVAKELEQFEKASIFFKAVTEMAPLHASAYGYYASCMMELDRMEEAKTYFTKALGLGEQPFVHIGIAQCAMYLGDKETAAKHSLRALEMNPDSLDLLYEYLNNHYKYKDAGDPYLKKLHEIETKQFRNLDTARQGRIYALLHKAYHDLKNYDESFKYACKASEARKKQDGGFSRQRAAQLHALRMAYFSKEFFETRKTSGNESDLPVFILGMPRSGTTLLEQILHAHKDIRGIGEDPHLTNLIAQKSYMEPSGRIPYLQRTTPIEQGIMALPDIAAGHLAYLQNKAPGAKRIADKAISNIYVAGILYLLFPKAHFIYIKRHPLDCCLSAFFANFNNNAQPYTNDLTDLGLTYAWHCETVAHWHKVLPAPILDVTYEDLVNDTEAQARRIIDFLELPWDENCLNFHETKKVVKTSSLHQVRQPIYKSSMAAWEKYEKHLKPLAAALGNALPDDSKHLIEKQ